MNLDERQVQALLGWASHLGDSMRKRQDGEYVLVGSSVGAFGALCWGVAALASAPAKKLVVPAIWVPVAVAICAIIAIMCLVAWKIRGDHMRRADEQLKQKSAFEAILTREVLAEFMPETRAVNGSSRSLAIVGSAAVVSVLFCLAVAVFVQAPLSESKPASSRETLPAGGSDWNLDDPPGPASDAVAVDQAAASFRRFASVGGVFAEKSVDIRTRAA